MCMHITRAPPLDQNMGARPVMSFLVTVFYVLLFQESTVGWQMPPRAFGRIDLRMMSSEVARFGGNETSPDHFKILLTEGDHMLVGARNYVYNISLATLRENKRLKWFSTPEDITLCTMKQKSAEQCQNYIRVLVKKSDSDLLVCGTNAYKPWCREYRNSLSSDYVHLNGRFGIANTPYDPHDNNTAIYVDNRLFTGTVSDMNNRDPLIYSEPMRTEQHDSQWLNEPNFVSSFDYGDKVYFFFRETAVEYINCGKTVYSRVARVCKNDQGGKNVLKNTWTSFFKARLNCSIPGEFPFYFDEIQSTSALGQGNYMPTTLWGNRSDMVYGVFNTPQNSISGSAVCAFRFSDIMKSFEGLFKEQSSPRSSWLPVNEIQTPSPHPAKECVNDSTRISDQTLNFIKKHPLMDQAVPAFGGQPVFLQTSFQSRLTQVAVDWQVPAADNHYYDVLFLGTDDGRVIKAINTGRSAEIETIVIEDIQVFENKAPVVNLRVYRKEEGGIEKLIVVSADEIKSIPLYRCHLHVECGSCLKLRDPYCSWFDNRCQNSNGGIQSIQDGTHPNCASQKPVFEGSPNAVSTTTPAREPCVCPPQSGSGQVQEGNKSPAPSTITTTGQPLVTIQSSERSWETEAIVIQKNKDLENQIPNLAESERDLQKDPKFSASSEQGRMYPAHIMALATILCALGSLIIGLIGGYYLSYYRHGRKRHDSYLDRKTDLHKSNVEHHYNHEPYLTNSIEKQKQLNVLYNPVRDSKKPNGSIETTVQPYKPKQEYL